MEFKPKTFGEMEVSTKYMTNYSQVRKLASTNLKPIQVESKQGEYTHFFYKKKAVMPLLKNHFSYLSNPPQNSMKTRSSTASPQFELNRINGFHRHLFKIATISYRTSAFIFSTFGSLSRIRVFTTVVFCSHLPDPHDETHFDPLQTIGT